MSSTSLTLKSAWKDKIEPTNVFDDNFLTQKDLALQPLEFIFEAENELNENNLNNLNMPLKEKEKTKKKSLKNSDIYDSNIIIIQSVSDDESENTSFNRIEKEVEKINKIIKNKLKKKKKHLSKAKKIKQ